MKLVQLETVLGLVSCISDLLTIYIYINSDLCISSAWEDIAVFIKIFSVFWRLTKNNDNHLLLTHLLHFVCICWPTKNKISIVCCLQNSLWFTRVDRHKSSKSVGTKLTVIFRSQCRYISWIINKCFFTGTKR